MHSINVYKIAEDLCKEKDTIRNKYESLVSEKIVGDSGYTFISANVDRSYLMLKDILNSVNNFSNNIIKFINLNDHDRKIELNCINFILALYIDLIYLFHNCFLYFNLHFTSSYKVKILKESSDEIENDFINFLITHQIKLIKINNDHQHFVNCCFMYENLNWVYRTRDINIKFFNKFIMHYNERINDTEITSIIFKYFNEERYIDGIF